jgi:hypothetical protein
VDHPVAVSANDGEIIEGCATAPLEATKRAKVVNFGEAGT